MKPIRLNAILGRVATKSDGSLSLTFSTQELPAEAATVLLLLARRELSMLLTPTGENAEAPVEVKPESGLKSPTARLRGVLYVLHGQLKAANKMELSFDEFYRGQLDRVIQGYKDMLGD